MINRFTRRAAARMVASLAIAPLTSAHAGRIIELKGGGFQPVNVAICNFIGDSAAQTITSVINNNLKRMQILQLNENLKLRN